MAWYLSKAERECGNQTTGVARRIFNPFQIPFLYFTWSGRRRSILREVGAWAVGGGRLGVHSIGTFTEGMTMTDMAWSSVFLLNRYTKKWSGLECRPFTTVSRLTPR
ncbi:hypothetical protein AVEN_121154-1 [Araneus ventricosus]|uniref:Uncharacterized protein n=1 Tax=Araneus ventricosus TaxID=182803 RepID=A0A4Y2DZV7_ARAVE|nr:hypothetical protein AVEN_121154-1 [Araneus ventricosus]